MKGIVMHPVTEHQFQAVVMASPQAVLITAPEGSGKKTIARKLSQTLLGGKTGADPNILEILPETSITIDQIRQIKDFIKHRTVGQGELRRAVLVLNAHTMSDEAQNALLKTLEEPPEDTVIILTASGVSQLKPTVRSRCLLLNIMPLSEQMATKHFAASHDSQNITTAYYTSDGRIGLMTALLEGGQEHGLVGAIAEAKRLLKLTAFERLAEVDVLTKDKDHLSLVLEGLDRVATSGLRQAAANQDQKSTKRFYNLSRSIQSAKVAMAKNANSKLVLTDLFLNL